MRGSLREIDKKPAQLILSHSYNPACVGSTNGNKVAGRLTGKGRMVKGVISKTEWKNGYINRLIRHGLKKKHAVESYKAMGEIDYTISPESSADDEVSYYD